MTQFVVRIIEVGHFLQLHTKGGDSCDDGFFLLPSTATHLPFRAEKPPFTHAKGELTRESDSLSEIFL